MNKYIYNLSIAAIFSLKGAYAQTNKPVNTVREVPDPFVVKTLIPNVYNSYSPASYVREKTALAPFVDLDNFNAQDFRHVQQRTTYMDGLGRPIQRVIRQGSSGLNPSDIVIPYIYNNLGRTEYSYLPYAAPKDDDFFNDGSFKSNTFEQQDAFYREEYLLEHSALANEKFYYSKVIFEESPLRRPLKQFSPGNSWVGSEGNSNEHGTEIYYMVNDLFDEVKIFGISNDNICEVADINMINIPTLNGVYPIGRLHKTVYFDEDHKMVVEYTDYFGRTILKKVQIGGTVNLDGTGYSGFASTYYIYDDLGNLRFVLPPLAVSWLLANNWDLGFFLSSTATKGASEGIYRYEYDERHRPIASKMPGVEWTYRVYDKRDRLVFSQDGNMRAKNQWWYIRFDALNRIVQTGIMSTEDLSHCNLQSQVNASTGNNSITTVTTSGTGGAVSLAKEYVITKRDVNVVTYRATETIVFEPEFESVEDDPGFETIIGDTENSTENSFINFCEVHDDPVPHSLVVTIALTENSYDNNAVDYNTDFNQRLSNVNTEIAADALPNHASIHTKDKIIFNRVKVIEDPLDLTKGNWLKTLNFYDNKGRVIQVQADHFKGGKEISTSLYSFSGKVLCNYLNHSDMDVSNSISIATFYKYDYSERLLSVKRTLNDISSLTRTTSQNEYDALGKLKVTHLGVKTDGSNTPLESQYYNYNIRGQLKGINNDRIKGSDWFSLDLSYDWGFEQSKFDGNLSGQVWYSRGSGQTRAFGYGYDAAGRMLFADFKEQNGTNWDNILGIDYYLKIGSGLDDGSAYDENGNIKSMSQKAWRLGGSDWVDQLSYQYSDYQNKLTSVHDNITSDNNSGDFKDKNVIGHDYDYDLNGNLIVDRNKEISSIQYNYLNLPTKIAVNENGNLKGTISYTYDASGNKLETITEELGKSKKITSYVGTTTYENDQLQFVLTEDCRIRPTMHHSLNECGFDNNQIYAFDYFVKDYQGNIRMLLTDEIKKDDYPAATMEIENAQVENQVYSRVTETRSGLPPGYDPSLSNYQENKQAAKLNGQSNKIGPGIMLKVMAGDKINISCDMWYRLLGGQSPGVPNSPFAELLIQMAAMAQSVTGGHLQSGLNEGQVFSSPLGFFLNQQNIPSDKPKASLNWILMDEQFNKAPGSSYEPVGESNEYKRFVKACIDAVEVERNGYIYIYTSNESNVDVYFDNLQVSHIHGPLLEESHYNAWGQILKGLSSTRSESIKNKYKANGGSILNDDLDLSLYETIFRHYDPQIGRFNSIDILSSLMADQSPYSYAFNSPCNYIDFMGLSPDDREYFKQGPDSHTATFEDEEAAHSYITDEKGDIGQSNAFKAGFKALVGARTEGQEENFGNREATETSKDDMDAHPIPHASNNQKTISDSEKTPWMSKAISQLGVSEDKRPGKSNPQVLKYHSTTGKFKDDDVPWCASFVNWSLVQSNIPSLNSARAFDYTKFGVKLDKPAYGAIAIMNYSHVGFVAGRNADGRIIILGGNQGDAVNYSPNSSKAVLQYRYPKGFTPNYDLPTYNMHGRSLTRGASR